jgi:hypothetical protein
MEWWMRRTVFARLHSSSVMAAKAAIHDNGLALLNRLKNSA